MTSPTPPQPEGTARTEQIIAGLPEHTNQQACFEGRRGYWVQTDCVLIERDDPASAISLFRWKMANGGHIACNHNLATSGIRLAQLERDLHAAQRRCEEMDLELGRVHGDIGLFAKKQFGISDNLPTTETFERMAREIHRIRETSTARLDSCIDSDDLLHRLFKEAGNPKTELGREIKDYMDMAYWEPEALVESLERRLAQARTLLARSPRRAVMESTKPIDEQAMARTALKEGK